MIGWIIMTLLPLVARWIVSSQSFQEVMVGFSGGVASSSESSNVAVVGVERRGRLVAALSVLVNGMVCLRADAFTSNSIGLDVIRFKVTPVKMLSLACLMAWIVRRR